MEPSLFGNCAAGLEACLTLTPMGSRRGLNASLDNRAAFSAAGCGVVSAAVHRVGVTGGNKPVFPISYIYSIRIRSILLYR